MCSVNTMPSSTTICNEPANYTYLKRKENDTKRNILNCVQLSYFPDIKDDDPKTVEEKIDTKLDEMCIFQRGAGLKPDGSEYKDHLVFDDVDHFISYLCHNDNLCLYERLKKKRKLYFDIDIEPTSREIKELESQYDSKGRICSWYNYFNSTFDIDKK